MASRKNTKRPVRDGKPAPTTKVTTEREDLRRAGDLIPSVLGERDLHLLRELVHRGLKNPGFISKARQARGVQLAEHVLLRGFLAAGWADEPAKPLPDPAPAYDPQARPGAMFERVTVWEGEVIRPPAREGHPAAGPGPCRVVVWAVGYDVEVLSEWHTGTWISTQNALVRSAAIHSALCRLGSALLNGLMVFAEHDAIRNEAKDPDPIASTRMMRFADHGTKAGKRVRIAKAKRKARS